MPQRDWGYVAAAVRMPVLEKIQKNLAKLAADIIVLVVGVEGRKRRRFDIHAVCGPR